MAIAAAISKVANDISITPWRSANTTTAKSSGNWVAISSPKARRARTSGRCLRVITTTGTPRTSSINSIKQGIQTKRRGSASTGAKSRLMPVTTKKIGTKKPAPTPSMRACNLCQMSALVLKRSNTPATKAPSTASILSRWASATMATNKPMA